MDSMMLDLLVRNKVLGYGGDIDRNKSREDSEEP